MAILKLHWPLEYTLDVRALYKDKGKTQNIDIKQIIIFCFT